MEVKAGRTAPVNPYRARRPWMVQAKALLFLVSLGLAAYEFGVVYLEADSQWSLLRRVAAGVSMALALLMHRPARQVVDIDIEGKPVRLELWFLFDHARLRWTAGSESGRIALGRRVLGLQWFEPRIPVGGISRRLLIGYDGKAFIVTNGHEPYAFAIRDNRFE